MSGGSVTLTREGAVAAVLFNRPEARNAMTWSMYEQLTGICWQLSHDRSVRVVTFSGAGDEAFVAGTDIGQFMAFGSGEQGGADGLAYEQSIDHGISLIESLPMPTLAVISGWTIGGGLAIATACDFRIATTSSRFGVPIARTLGNCLSVANIARLGSAWGMQRLKRMLLLAELVDAAEALESGFLQQVCEPADLAVAAAALCERLSRLAPVTQRVSKEAMRRLRLHDLPDGDDLVRQCYGSHDFRVGVQAFVSKSSPQWTGE